MLTVVAVMVALTFVWFGLVLGISFIEAPLKFRASGVTRVIGVSIGQLIFRTIGTLEIALFATIVIAGLFALGTISGVTWVVFLLLGGILALQGLVIRPRLASRARELMQEEGLIPTQPLPADGVDAEESVNSHSKSRAWVHQLYLILEIMKAIGIIVVGVQLFVAFASVT